MKEKNFDQRIYKRNIASSVIKSEDYQKYLKSLPDDSGNYDVLPFEDPLIEVPLMEAPSEEPTIDAFQDD